MNGLVLSVFPGIGLLDMAFELEGFCVVRGPDVLWGGDIRKFHPPAGRFDGVIGGPPCQAFSALSHLVRANGHEPKFGNLIPEFERVVAETDARWFLMENVQQAPVPSVVRYSVGTFMLNNAWLPDADGFGQEQERKRRFSFGTRVQPSGDWHAEDYKPVNLMRWIRPAALMLMEQSRSVTALGPDREIDEAIEADLADWPRTDAEIDDLIERGHAEPYTEQESRERAERVIAQDEWEKTLPAAERRRVRAMFGDGRPTRREHRTPAFTSSDGAGKVKRVRYGLVDAMRLQGLPEGFLDDAPFTAAGKLKAVANGVPLPMGRAVARAVKKAIGIPAKAETK